MRKIKAFFLAMVLFCITIYGLKGHYDAIEKEGSRNNDIRYDISFEKLRSHNIIANNIDQNTLVVMGSSELSRSLNSKFHPRNMVDFKDMKYMMIGRGFFTSISHVITLGSVEQSIQNRKVVLFLSPQWFRPEGVPKDAFAARYSEDHLINFLKNQDISTQIKDRVVNRVKELLSNNQKLADNIDGFKKVFVDKNADAYQTAYVNSYSSFMNRKFEYQYLTNNKINSKPNNKKYEKPEFEKLFKEADIEGGKQITNNNYGIMNDYWNKHIKDKYPKLKDSDKDIKYVVSKEYTDLSLFLDLAKELNLDVELVSTPVNGPWYDYIGHSKEDREAYYQNIRDIATKYKVNLLDLSSYEYEPHFFKDATHFAWKGWVVINEELIKFAKK